MGDGGADAFGDGTWYFGGGTWYTGDRALVFGVLFWEVGARLVGCGKEGQACGERLGGSGD